MRILFSFLLFFAYSSTYAIPTIQHWQTSNGARVYFVPAMELPMVDIEITFDAGSARDGNQFGVATLTNALLSEGAGSLDADAIAEKFDSLGASFTNSAGRDMASTSMRSLTEANLLQPALETYALLLAQPTFSPKAVARVQRQLLVQLQYQQQDFSSITDNLFYKTLYGDHPYAHPQEGTLTTIKALTPEDVKAFHQRYYVAKNAVIAIVGALTRAQAEHIATQLVAELATGTPAAPLPPVKLLTQAQIHHSEQPSEQTHLLLGQPVYSRHDPDYFTLYVGNHILGGSGFTARILREVREKRGLAYSAYSYFNPLRVKGPFVIGLQTRNDQTQQALAVVKETLHTFIEQGPTEEELQVCQQSITGGFALRVDSNSKIVNYLSVIGFYNMPLNHLQTFSDKVNAVTTAMIKDAFQRRVKPETFVTITVGKKATAN